ncbi:ABC transporter permease [Nakamurella endophytica]|uniref:ABC transporter permease n=1 Tax=Nakamurella endophytica TaxID=1748367 RepID=A0A917TAT8_9ACTN|nr:ABC transporter permease [Nakamurella endophytica]
MAGSADGRPGGLRGPWFARRRPRRGPAGSVLERVAVVVALVMVVLAVVGPWIAPQNPYRVDLGQSLLPPSAAHLFGTDVNGRDVFSRVLTGARETLLATVIVLVVATVLGVLIGTAAALGGRVVDEVLMRICDIGLSLPSIVLALGLAASLGPSLTSAVVAMCLTWWPGYARLVRTVVRQHRDAEYVEAARSIGAGPVRVVVRHLLPTVVPVMLVQVTLDVAAVMLVISGLSFVGVGAQVPAAEWGAMIAAAVDDISTAWWALLFPGLAIAVTAVAFNLAGDWLRVRTDPTVRWSR